MADKQLALSWVERMQQLAGNFKMVREHWPPHWQVPGFHTSFIVGQHPLVKQS